MNLTIAKVLLEVLDFFFIGASATKSWENSWQFLGKGQNTTAGGGATAIQDRRIFAGSESEYPVIKYPANYS